MISKCIDSFNRFAEANEEYKDVMLTAIDEAKALEQQIVDGTLEIPYNTAVPNWETIKAAN